MASKRRRTSKAAPRSTGTTGGRRAAPRVRRVPNWGFWLWVIALVNVIGGLWISPITGPVKISLRGVQDQDEKFITSIVSDYRQVPWLRLNRYEIESKIGSLGHLKSVAFEPNIFGRATVTAVYREPVVRLAGTEGLCLDGTGEVYRESRPAEVPEVQVPGDSQEISGCLLGSWPRAGIVLTIKEMGRRLPQLDYSLELDAKSVLSLEVTDGPTVILGSSSALEEKIKKLAELYSNEGVAFTQSTVLNLMAPDRPTIKD